MRLPAHLRPLDESGLGLLEILIAGSIMMLTTLAMFGSITYLTRSQRTLSQSSSLDSTASGITRLLADTNQCALGFKDPASVATGGILAVPSVATGPSPYSITVPEISIGSGSGAMILA